MLTSDDINMLDKINAEAKRLNLKDGANYVFIKLSLPTMDWGVISYGINNHMESGHRDFTNLQEALNIIKELRVKMS